MHRWLGIAVLLAAGTAQAQRGAPAPPQGQEVYGVWGYEGHREGRFVETEADHRLVVERDPFGRTRIKVLAPERAVVHVLQQGREVYVDEVPTVFDAAPNARYRLQVVLPDGAVWTRPVETRLGAVAKLWVNAGGPPAQPVYVQTVAVQPPPPPPGPQPMAGDRFARLVEAIRAESFSQQQLAVLQTAAAHEYFTVDQVGRLVDLYSFPRDKVEAVKLTRPHVLDPENGYTLSSHFDFNNDKQTVQRMFQ